MSVIIKNEAVVLKKTKFSDSSLIVQFYTRENGKISAIIKGARSSKSKIGSKIDTLNQVEIVFYKKEGKDLQLVTQVNLIEHFPKLKEDLDKIKYASSIAELLLQLLPEQEVNDKLFRGTVKLFSLLNASEKNPLLLFTQYLIFFTKEIGYELSFEHCSNCSNLISDNSGNGFNYSDGIICKNCVESTLTTFQLSEELFNLFKCLSTKRKLMIINSQHLENIIFILEKFLIYHNPDFKGLKSLKYL
ncbi:MAG: DNA repair protein RecO [Ignavibacteriae bacterium]|nr:MAG: DNA repair protein RecO [Ignavibacteriota bacterium]